MAPLVLWEKRQFLRFLVSTGLLRLSHPALRLSCELTSRSVSHSGPARLVKWTNHWVEKEREIKKQCLEVRFSGEWVEHLNFKTLGDWVSFLNDSQPQCSLVSDSLELKSVKNIYFPFTTQRCNCGKVFPSDLCWNYFEGRNILSWVVISMTNCFSAFMRL